MSNDDSYNPYSALAPYYDYILQHVDYQSWYLFITSVMIEYHPNPRTVLELGCGTGRFGAKFSNDGFFIVGVDLSLDMLMVAKSRAFKNFRILCSDIRTFSFQKPFDFIFSVHDTVNYLMEENDIASFLQSVKGTMNDKSIFLFDITTEYNINRNFTQHTSRYKTRGTDISWSNSYDTKTSIVTSKLVFHRSGVDEKTEYHQQRLYPVKTIKELINEAGLELLAVYGDYEMRPPKNDTVMINFVVKKA